MSRVEHRCDRKGFLDIGAQTGEHAIAHKHIALYVFAHALHAAGISEAKCLTSLVEGIV